MEYIIALVIVGGLIWLILRSKLKKRISSIPELWDELLTENVQFYGRLTEKEKRKFKRRMLDFLNEVYVEGIEFELEEIDRVLIAASAVIPVFKFKNWGYTSITGVIIYPENFDEKLAFGEHASSKPISGLVGSGKFENQMIISRKALHHGFKNHTDKRNTAVHEFVHLLDKQDGDTDGVPENLMDKQYVMPWLKLMHKEMEAINNNKSDIRKYGGTQDAEFFAVASEYFFERPKLMRKKHPELYKMLKMCFRDKKK